MKAVMKKGVLTVPDQVSIPFIIGDGIGPDIWHAAVRVFESAVQKSYGEKRKILWKEVLAGSKAHEKTGQWLPEETVNILREYLIGIKGPLTTPVGGGIRSLNVALRQNSTSTSASVPCVISRASPLLFGGRSLWTWLYSGRILKMCTPDMSSRRAVKKRES